MSTATLSHSNLDPQASRSGASTPRPTHVPSGPSTPLRRTSPTPSTRTSPKPNSNPSTQADLDEIEEDIHPGDILDAEIATAYAAQNPSDPSLTEATSNGIEVEPSRPVPKTFMSSLGEWWRASEDEGRVAELRLLSRLPFFTTSPPPPSSSTNLYATVSSVPISSTEPSKRFLNCVTFSTPALDLDARELKEERGREKSGSSEAGMDDEGVIRPSERATVLLHGYGAGLCFFYQNFASLANACTNPSSVPSSSSSSSSTTPALPPRRLFALDWLGMGRSARVPPKELLSEKGKRASTEERVEKAEAFFVESLDRWREEMGLKVMTLVGHSLGGYLSAAYALKYPHRVDRLILLSPAGIPDHTDEIDSAPPVAATPAAASAAAAELTQSQMETTGGTDPKAGSGADVKKVEVEASGEGKEGPKKDIGVGGGTPKNNGRAGKLRPVFTWMWEQGWSPFGVLRSIGPLGPLMAGRYSSRRFAALGEEDIKDMHSYIWHITRMKGSSEYCISHLLAPGAYARMPMVNRIDKLKIPILFAYGDRDWMDPEGGRASIKKLKDAGNREAELYIIRNAGHHLYLDNSESSNKMLAKAIREQARVDSMAN